MTNEDKREIAEMIAAALTQNAPSQTTEAPQIVPEAEVVQDVKEDTPVAVSVAEELEEDKHLPSLSSKQVVDILNEVRMEVRVQYKQPWVEAMETLFKNPVATAVIDGRKKPLVDADQVNTMIAHLKKTGKLWPQIVCTILNEEGDRQYVNTSYKREDGNKWKEGSILKVEPEVEVIQS
jgi:hypothetical protein